MIWLMLLWAPVNTYIFAHKRLAAQLGRVLPTEICQAHLQGSKAAVCSLNLQYACRQPVNPRLQTTTDVS
jgi:hypothetical protein